MHGGALEVLLVTSKADSSGATGITAPPPSSNVSLITVRSASTGAAAAEGSALAAVSATGGGAKEQKNDAMSKNGTVGGNERKSSERKSSSGKASRPPRPRHTGRKQRLIENPFDIALIDIGEHIIPQLAFYFIKVKCTGSTSCRSTGTTPICKNRFTIFLTCTHSIAQLLPVHSPCTTNPFTCCFTCHPFVPNQ